jgi:hypothetical protein
MALAKVKVQPPLASTSPAAHHQSSNGDAATSPNRMVSVYQNLSGTTESGEASVPGLTVRPTRVHTNTLPHNPTYNPYDLGALLADFKLKKSPSAGAAPPAPHFSGARVVNRTFSCTDASTAVPAKRSPFMSATGATAKPSPAAKPSPPQEHRSEGLVMIPGMRRVNTVG